jgi:tRNA (guanine-N7-)-methyltransferase
MSQQPSLTQRFLSSEAKNNNSHNSTKLIRSYGRIKSRKLSDNKKLLLQEVLPLYEFKIDNLAQLNINQKNILEIGFGFGDFLFNQVVNNPQFNFIGCEPHINGVVNLLAKLHHLPDSKLFPNLKISQIDVRLLLDKIPNYFFDEIYILFPDPWPKHKHYKRRLINLEFLQFLAKKIKPHGKLIIATDHDAYKAWILAAILRCSDFYLPVENQDDLTKFPLNWIMTKYQKKAILEGRQPVIFNLQKCSI